MAQITYITPDGEQVVVEAWDGNLMTAAVQNQVRGIDGECGGVCACGTCHVQIDPAWMACVGPAGDEEAATLGFDDNVTNTSRLGCQIPIGPELEGLKVRVIGR